MSFIGKRGVLGDATLIVYQVFFISFVAFVILGISSFFYDYYLDVRDVESSIMVRNVVDCLAEDGVVNVENIGFESRYNLLVYCGFSEFDASRFYVKGEIVYADKVFDFESGDSGKIWVKNFYEELNPTTEGVVRYTPGYFPLNLEEVKFPVFVLDNEVLFEGYIKMEVLVSEN